jgi:hypothetical protein
MASVNRVYTALKDLVNKDQKGFVSPSIFNSFAGLAQNSIYNRLFDEHRNAMKFRRAGVDPGKSLGKTKFIEEDLSVFHKKAKLSQVNGVFEKPSDFGRLSSITTNSSYVFNTTVGTNVQVMHSQEDIDRALMSDLSKPSVESPIALMGSDVEVFPNNIKKIELRYYKLPQGLNTLTGAKSASQPKFGYSTAIPGVELYDLNLSVDFELPEHFFTDIVIEIAQLIGINLRDQAVAQYAAVEKQKEENK